MSDIISSINLITFEVIYLIRNMYFNEFFVSNIVSMRTEARANQQIDGALNLVKGWKHEFSDRVEVQID